MQEMEAAALIGNHPNLVRVHSVCEVADESKVMLVLERADGRYGRGCCCDARNTQ